MPVIKEEQHEFHCKWSNIQLTTSCNFNHSECDNSWHYHLLYSTVCNCLMCSCSSFCHHMKDICLIIAEVDFLKHISSPYCFYAGLVILRNTVRNILTCEVQPILFAVYSIIGIAIWSYLSKNSFWLINIDLVQCKIPSICELEAAHKIQSKTSALTRWNIAKSI